MHIVLTENVLRGLENANWLLKKIEINVRNVDVSLV